MEGYQTLDGRSKSFAIGKTSKPPARRSRARGFVAFFIAAETLHLKRAACFNSFEGRKQRVGRLRPRKGRARLVGQESARLDLQKPICRRPASTNKIPVWCGCRCRTHRS